MADTAYHNFFARILSKAINCAAGGDTFKLALFTDVRASIDPDATAYATTNEAVGTGYTAGGFAFTNTNNAVADVDASNWATFDIAEDAAWASSTITARWADLYSATDSNSLVGCFDFTANQSSSNGTFTVQFSANGIMRLA
jgi:hypothetical protein